MHGQDPSGDDESVDTAEMAELIASITSVSHKECDMVSFANENCSTGLLLLAGCIY